MADGKMAHVTLVDSSYSTKHSRLDRVDHSKPHTSLHAENPRGFRFM